MASLRPYEPRRAAVAARVNIAGVTASERAQALTSAEALEGWKITAVLEEKDNDVAEVRVRVRSPVEGRTKQVWMAEGAFDTLHNAMTEAECKQIEWRFRYVGPVERDARGRAFAMVDWVGWPDPERVYVRDMEEQKVDLAALHDLCEANGVEARKGGRKRTRPLSLATFSDAAVRRREWNVGRVDVAKRRAEAQKEDKKKVERALGWDELRGWKVAETLGERHERTEVHAVVRSEKTGERKTAWVMQECVKHHSDPKTRAGVRYVGARQHSVDAGEDMAYVEFWGEKGAIVLEDDLPVNVDLDAERARVVAAGTQPRRF